MAIRSTAALAYDTIEEQAHANIYNLFNTKTNIADPLGTNNRKMVYVKEPQSKGREFAGYPYIIVQPASVSFGNYTKSLTKTVITGTIPFIIRASDTTPGRFKERGNELVSHISNDIIKTIHANKALFINYKMGNLSVRLNSTESVDVAEDECLEKTGEVYFEDVIKVTV